MTYDEWMQRNAEVIGTHYDGCFKHHPECAAIMGEQAAPRRIRAIIEDEREFYTYHGEGWNTLTDALNRLDDEGQRDRAQSSNSGSAKNGCNP